MSEMPFIKGVGARRPPRWGAIPYFDRRARRCWRTSARAPQEDAQKTLRIALLGAAGLRREGDDEFGSAARSVGGDRRAAVSLGDRGDDREAQARPDAVASAGPVGPPESIKHVLLGPRLKPVTMVTDLHPHESVLVFDRDLDRRP